MGKSPGICSPIKEFYLLTTANNDQAMEQLARELCLELLQKTGRSVPYKVWGWGRVCDALLSYPDLTKIFQPDYGLRSQEHSDSLAQGVVSISIQDWFKGVMTLHFCPKLAEYAVDHTLKSAVADGGAVLERC